jgi:fumigaclavine B O-acetyltransferase
MTKDVPFPPYKLTPFDHLLSMFYGGCALSFRLDRPEDGVATLCAGVDCLTSHLPFLNGNVVQRKDRGEVMEVHASDSSKPNPPLVSVRRFPDLRLPSLASSEAREDWQNYDRDASLILIPLEVASSPVHPVIRFQVNVLADGIILTLFVNHKAIDGTGVGTIIEGLATCCRTGPNREVISLPTNSAAEAATRAVLDSTGPDSADMDARADEHAAPALGEEVLHDPFLLDYNFRFSARKVQQLKDRAEELLLEYRDGETRPQQAPSISCDDVVTALLWACLSRIRSHRAGNGDSVCTLTRAVDVRKRFSGSLPATYLGNCVIFVNETRPLKELHGMEIAGKDMEQRLARVISQIAHILRSRLNGVDYRYIRQILSHSTDREDETDHRPDVSVTSVRHMRVYEQDFGPLLGRGENFEMLPYMNPEGVCTIRPKRATEDTWEVSVSLSREDMGLLKKDPWLCWILEEGSLLKVFEPL